MGIRELAGLSSDAKHLAIYNGAYNFASGLYGFIAVFYVTSLGYSAAFFGALSAAGEAALVISLLGAPHVASRTGARGSIAAGTALTAASVAALAFSSTPPMLMASFIGAGTGQALVSPNLSSLISTSEPGERRTAAFVASGFLGQVGAFLGTALSGTMADALQPEVGRVDAYRWVIAAASLAMASAVAASAGVKLDLRPGQNPWRIRREDLGTMWRLVAAATMIGAGAGFLIPFFPLQFKYRFGSSASYISLLFSTTNAAMAALMLYMPELERRLGSLNAIVGSWALATALMVIMPASSRTPFGEAIFSALYLGRTTVMNAIGPVQSSFELSMLAPDERPAFSSLETISWNAANAATVALGGLIMQQSLDAPFYVCGAFYSAAAAFYYASFRGSAGRRRAP